jgi:hypothetical protein
MPFAFAPNSYLAGTIPHRRKANLQLAWSDKLRADIHEIIRTGHRPEHSSKFILTDSGQVMI